MKKEKTVLPDTQRHEKRDSGSVRAQAVSSGVKVQEIGDR